MSVDSIKNILKTVMDPNLGVDLVSAREVKAVRLDDGVAHVDIELGYPARSQFDAMAQTISAALASAGVASARVTVSSKIVAHTVQRGLKVLPQVKNILAVSSGKGGVGKSTVAANLALALVAEGARVGVLDADIYGPSQPTLLGVHGKPDVTEDKRLVPKLAHGLQVASMGFLVGPEQPMVWRGPMVTQAMNQLLHQTAWDDLDYLVIDMPPGTGDIQLTLAQQVPVTGAIIVTTPQDLALADAIKGLRMFEKVGVPILGVVENMAVHVCSQCGHTEHMFGQGGAQKMAQRYGMEVLGALPLDRRIREQTDGGVPTVVAAPESDLAQLFGQIARQVAIRVAQTAKDRSLKVPVVEVSAS